VAIGADDVGVFAALFFLLAYGSVW